MRTSPSSTTPPLVEPELGIWFDSRAYHYQHYRYDRLQDTVAYAKIDMCRPGFHADRGTDSVLTYGTYSLSTSRLFISSSGSFSSCAGTLSAASLGPYVVIAPPSGRVLVVDDNEDLAYLFSMLVQEMMGYDTRTVFSARAALGVMPTYLPHVVFYDIGMPEVSGYDLARTIRASGSAQPLLVSVSGWNDAKTVTASRNAGFDLHLGKPVSYDEVDLLLVNYFRGISVGNPSSQN